jgi:hypothetical protein
MRSGIIALCIALLLINMTSASAVYLELGYGIHHINSTLQASGGPVDFYLTNVTAYMVYKASAGGDINFGYLYYLADYSAKNAGSINYELTAFVENTLVIVIDNSAWTEGGADPIGEVVVRGTIEAQSNVWTWQNIAITALVIGVIIAFMVGVKLPKKK